MAMLDGGITFVAIELHADISIGKSKIRSTRLFGICFPLDKPPNDLRIDAARGTKIEEREYAPPHLS
jgi:hypothetical protein